MIEHFSKQLSKADKPDAGESSQISLQRCNQIVLMSVGVGVTVSCFCGRIAGVFCK